MFNVQDERRLLSICEWIGSPQHTEKYAVLYKFVKRPISSMTKFEIICEPVCWKAQVDAAL